MEFLISTIKEIGLLGFSLLIIGGMLHLLLVVIKGNGYAKKIFNVQKEKYPEIKEFLSELLPAINQVKNQNKILLENHFQHEIPEMLNGIRNLESSFGRFESKMDRMVEILTQINTKLK